MKMSNSNLKIINEIVNNSEFPSKIDLLDSRLSNSVALQLNEILLEGRTIRCNLKEGDTLRYREEHLFHYASLVADNLFSQWDYVELNQAIFPLFFNILPLLTDHGLEEFLNVEISLIKSTLGPDSPVLDFIENIPQTLPSLIAGCHCNAFSDLFLFRTLTLSFLQPEVVSFAISNTDEDYPWYVRAGGWALLALNATASVPTVGVALASIGVGAVTVTVPKPKFPPEEAKSCNMRLFVDYDPQKGFYVGGLLEVPNELFPDGKVIVFIYYGRYPNLSNVVRKEYEVRKGVFGWQDFDSYLSPDLTKWDLIAGSYPNNYWSAKGIGYVPNYNPCTTIGLPRVPGSNRIPE